MNKEELKEQLKEEVFTARNIVSAATTAISITAVLMIFYIYLASAGMISALNTGSFVFSNSVLTTITVLNSFVILFVLGIFTVWCLKKKLNYLIWSIYYETGQEEEVDQ